MKKGIFTLIVTSILSLSVPVFAEQKQEIYNNDEYVSETAINDQIELRKVLGLDTSRDHIIKTLIEKPNQELYKTYGMYLLDSEKEKINKFEKINEFIPKMYDLINETKNSPSDIASFYIDLKKEKVIVYFSKKDEKAKEIKNELKKSFPFPEMLIFKDDSFSSKDLENTKLKIKENFNKELFGSKVTSITTNSQNNNLEVGVYPYNEKIEDALKSDFGDMIEVLEKKETVLEARTTPLYHMQGGLLIASNKDRSLNPGQYDPYCTLGFTAEYQGQDYLVTAGHCIENANYRGEIYYYQGGEIIGANSTYGNNSNYDLGLIKLTSSKNATNYIYKYSSFDSKYTRETYGYPYAGQPVCISGATSGFRCGNVTDTKSDMIFEKINGTLVYATRTQADYSSDGGDSGAPVWYGGILLGVHNASNGHYTDIQTAMSYIDFKPIVRY